MNLNEYEVVPDPLWFVLQFSGADGYDYIEVAFIYRWMALPSWGEEGFDLGQWPLVVIFTKNKPDCFQLAQTIEGDITQWHFPTQELRDAAITELATYWREQATT